MKLIITTLFVALFMTTLCAQTPQAFNYQAVARNLSGTPMPNQDIGVKISVLEGDASGAVVYSETHSLTTSDLGLFNLQIGNGDPTGDAFSSIDWGSEKHFFQVEMDENGGTNYEMVGTSEFLSVPYAEYANNGSKWDEVEVDSRINYPNKVGIGNPIVNQFDYNLNINESSEGTIGMSVINPNLEGRSAVIVGKSDLLQYMYIAYNNDNYVPSNYNDVFLPKMGVIFSGGDNGLSQVVPNGDINFITGDLDGDFERFVIKNNGNLGVDTDNPTSKLQVNNGDVKIEDINRGVIMTSPNGQCWRYTPDNNGQLIGTQISCN